MVSIEGQINSEQHPDSSSQVSLSLLYGSPPLPTRDGHLSFVWESTLECKNLHFEYQYPYYIGLINVKWYAMYKTY